MVILEKVLEKLFYFIGLSFLVKIISFSRKTRTSKIPKILSRLFTILIFLISILSLAFYSLVIIEVGIVKRIIAGILAIIFLGYLIHTIKGYREDEKIKTN
ncbi:hypothetical protein [Peptoniphilus raoultii]|uniref:hypothetical protein n=1 Tax=Peptoniphilus raoultii TaxID=1776387 RepID=UPI0008D9F157|nr:hypothetical protein [Peptoniphilus raoultii]